MERHPAPYVYYGPPASRGGMADSCLKYSVGACAAAFACIFMVFMMFLLTSIGIPLMRYVSNSIEPTLG